jgi:site-specific DNA-cytosine methylase
MGEGWKLSVGVPGSNVLSDKLQYLKNEGIVYIKGYSGMKGFRSIDEPTYTLCAIGPLGLYDSELNRVRSITINEAMIIQGFPDSYKIPDIITNKDAYRLIGNSISPPISYLMLRDKK